MMHITAVTVSFTVFSVCKCCKLTVTLHVTLKVASL